MTHALAANPRTAIKAAIKRGSAQARAAMNRLDRQALGELDQIYRQAAANIEFDIRGYAGSDGSVRLEVLQDLLRQVHGRLDQLSIAQDRLIGASMVDAAQLGVRPYAVDPLVTESLSRVSDEAVRFVRSFVAEDGLQLSDRLWRLDNSAKQAVSQSIESAVIQGHSASRAASDLLGRGQPVPADLKNKLQSANADGIARATAKDILHGDGNPRYNALRVMRTEINRAHGEAYIAGGEGVDDFAGWRFLLSPRHPAVDICDMHARANLYGLGAGVYPSRKRTPWPAHPNTLSYVEIVFLDEITEEDRAGKDARLDWLKKQPTAVQEGVLGSRKKRAALQRGLLKQNEIATPWRVLKKRYSARGVDTDTLLPAASVVARGITIDEIRAEAVDYVKTAGERSGWEYAVAYDANSLKEIVRKTSRKKNAVSFGIKEISYFVDPARKIELVHNHPSSSSLSQPDLRIGTFNGIYRVVAVGHDGTRYSARTTTTAAFLDEVYRSVDSRIDRHMRALFNSGRLASHQAGVLWGHSINSTLHRLGLIDYRVEVITPGGLLSDALAALDDGVLESVISSAESYAMKRHF